MIRIESLTAKEDILTLAYKVSNPFRYEIWVCEDIDVYGNYDVETRITTDKLQIKLCFDLDCNVMGEVCAKYRRLSPGESHSGTIRLKLPVENASPVYRFRKDSTKYAQVSLHHVVFVVGYMEGKYIDRAHASLKRIKRDFPGASNIVNLPHVREEILDGQSRRFAIVPHIWQGLAKEKAAAVVITDVEVPCLIEGD